MTREHDGLAVTGVIVLVVVAVVAVAIAIYQAWKLQQVDFATVALLALPALLVVLASLDYVELKGIKVKRRFAAASREEVAEKVDSESIENIDDEVEPDEGARPTETALTAKQQLVTARERGRKLHKSITPDALSRACTMLGLPPLGLKRDVKTRQTGFVFDGVNETDNGTYVFEVKIFWAPGSALKASFWHLTGVLETMRRELAGKLEAHLVFVVALVTGDDGEKLRTWVRQSVVSMQKGAPPGNADILVFEYSEDGRWKGQVAIEAAGDGR